jgi:hypothetical protein
MFDLALQTKDGGGGCKRDAAMAGISQHWMARRGGLRQPHRQ